MKNYEKVFWKCGGGNLPFKWGYGYWIGKNRDLLCLFPNLIDKEAEKYLSPICRSKIMAYIKFYWYHFILKKMKIGT